MAKNDFASQVGRHIAKYPRLMEAVYQRSAQETIREAQTPVAKGGRMRVDTGFLINSGQAALNSIPSGASEKPENYRKTDWDAQPMVLVLNKATLEDRIVFGWTANYAVYREAQDAFLRLAAQNWPQTVNRVAKETEKRIRK